MTTPRIDLYTAVHKGLRALLFESLLAAGRTDPEDAPAVEALGAQLRDVLHLFEVHLADEDAHIHPALAARAPEVLARAEDDHHEQAALSANVVQALEALETHRTREHLAAVVRHLTVFTTHGLAHMQHEELHHSPALWRTHSDAELSAIHTSVVSAIPPRELSAFLRCIISASSDRERLVM